MDITEVAQQGADADAVLRSWDWKATLREQERSLNWLARKTSRPHASVSNYFYGRFEPPIEWLRDVARVLGRGI